MKKFLSIATAVLSVAACTSGHDGWTLKGDIEGGAGKTVYIEGSTIGNWYLIDSVAIGEDDTFDYIAAKQTHYPPYTAYVWPTNTYTSRRKAPRPLH